jgi:hypothetical protein
VALIGVDRGMNCLSKTWERDRCEQQQQGEMFYFQTSILSLVRSTLLHQST